MKIKTLSILLLSLTLIISGCSTVQGIFGSHSTAIAKQSDKIVQVDKQISSTQAQKMSEISQLNYGTLQALKRVTNSTPPVDVATEMATRVESLAGLPTLQQQAAMSKMIADLIAANKQGVAELKKKDLEISALQQEEVYLVNQKQKEVDNLTTLSKATALQADTTKAELDKYTAYWGLGGIFLGLKSLTLHLIWATIIFIVIFIVLRALAFSNPLAAAIFGILQSVGASVIHLIEVAIPQSIATLNDAKAGIKIVSDAVDTVAQLPSSTIRTPSGAILNHPPTSDAGKS